MSIDISKQIYSSRPVNSKYYIIGIDGRGGAGKTTLAEYVIKKLPGFIVINGDDYFEPDENTIAFGSFNEKRFAKDVIEPLQQPKADFLIYPFNWHTKPHITEKKISIDKGVILERSQSFAFEINYDLKIWVQTSAKLALERGQERDEMPLEQGYRSWKEVWQPQEDAHFKKVKPLETADIIIDGAKPFEKQIH